MATEQTQETRTRVLLEQVNRAHAGLAHFQRARMRSMGWGGAVTLVLLLLGYTKWVPLAAFALPFAVVYFVVHYGYYTHLVVLSRALVAELEHKVNTDLGETLLISEALESKYTTPLGAPHFLGISAGNLWSIFSITTIHYLFLCFLMFLAGALRSQFLLKSPELSPVGRLGDIYSPLLLLWTLANILYLVVFFVKGEQEKALIATIRKELKKAE